MLRNTKCKKPLSVIGAAGTDLIVWLTEAPKALNEGS